MEKGKKIINYFTVLGFFLILAFPMVNGYMQFIEDKEVKENRKVNEADASRAGLSLGKVTYMNVFTGPEPRVLAAYSGSSFS